MLSPPAFPPNRYRAGRRNLNYWDSAASFAGEVDNPGKTYPRALVACVVLVILCYALPLLVGTGSAAVAASSSIEEGRWDLWVDGYFADVATAIAGRWLGIWVVLAAAAANIGLFEAEMSSDAFQLMGMVRQSRQARALDAWYVVVCGDKANMYSVMACDAGALPPREQSALRAHSNSRIIVS